MAVVLKGEKMLKGRVKRKQQAREEIEENIKNRKTKLWSLRKQQLLGIFSGGWSRHGEQVEALKQNIKSGRAELNKLKEEIYGLAKGHEGEEQVTVLLKEELPDDFYIINGKKLKVQGEKVEIDHIVLGPKGLICMEVKNTSGRFYFDREEESWLKTPFSKPHALKIPMASPLQQVKQGAALLKKLLLEQHKSTGIDILLINWYNLVVFASDRCLFPGIKNRWNLGIPLLLKDEVVPYIDSLPEDSYLSASDRIEELAQVILSCR